MGKKRLRRKVKALSLDLQALERANARLWTELQEWRSGRRIRCTPRAAPPEPEERVCSGRGVHGQYITLWGTWFGRVTPCATMTGCVKKAKWDYAGFLDYGKHKGPHKTCTHPCEVMS